MKTYYYNQEGTLFRYFFDPYLKSWTVLRVDADGNQVDDLTLYKGWANYQTWNVALWLRNDEDLYRLARGRRRRAFRTAGVWRSYESLVTYLKYVCQMPDTPDGVAWDDPALDTERLEALIAELRGDA